MLLPHKGGNSFPQRGFSSCNDLLGTSLPFKRGALLFPCDLGECCVPGIAVGRALCPPLAAICTQHKRNFVLLPSLVCELPSAGWGGVRVGVGTSPLTAEETEAQGGSQQKLRLISKGGTENEYLKSTVWLT